MHVDAENDASEDAKSTRKLTPSMLDNFTNLTKNKLKVRVKSGVSLIKYLNEKSDTENVRLTCQTKHNLNACQR